MSKKLLRRGGLFDELDYERADAVAEGRDWTPEEPPVIPSDVKEIELDFETTGLRWWEPEKCRAIGVAVGWRQGDEYRTQYMSWGHKTNAPRHDEATVKRWFSEQVRNKLITNSGTKLEVHVGVNEGIDFEALGCVMSDIGHHAALLDDHRKTFSQEDLCAEFLTDERKVTSIGGVDLDPSRMAWHPPGFVAVRAEADVRQVGKLKDVFLPMMEAQGLLRVKALEDDCIFASCEMERNGVIIDKEKLSRWAKEARADYEKLLVEIHSRTGIKFNPDSGDDWSRLFAQRGIQNLEMTRGKKPKQSFTDAVLQGALDATNDEVVMLGRKAGKLADLLSKYLDKYDRTVGEDRILRFALHQLRDDDGGTISGRFASAALDPKDGGGRVGANIQQILALEKQLESYGPDYVIRELIIPAKDDELVISADAEQIEYRLFSHYANNAKVIEAYRENPRLSFHKLVHAYLLPFKPDLLYKPLKNMNFMKIYGGGIVKLALMMGHITAGEAAELNAMVDDFGRPDYRRRDADPRLAKTWEVQRVYDSVLPEVKPLTKRVTALATERGWVRTHLGRRTRFIKRKRLDGTTYVDRPHKALNGVIQGGAGDVMKRKMVEAHREARRIGFTPRMTVHDQIVGDGTKETACELSTLLDQQSFEFRVPILWAVAAKPNLRMCDEKE